MIDKYRYAANDITSNNQHMYGYKEIELESHVHIQANRATSFRLFFPWASLLNHQVNVQMNEQNDQGNSYILLLPMFTCSWCHHIFAERKSPDKKNLPTLKKALVSIWHYKSAYWLQLTTLISSIICNLGKSKNKSIPSLKAWKEGDLCNQVEALSARLQASGDAETGLHARRRRGWLVPAYLSAWRRRRGGARLREVVPPRQKRR